MTDIKWEDPPPKWESKNQWHAIAEALRAKPGEWAMVGKHSSNVAHGIRSGSRLAFRPQGAFEVRTTNKVGNRLDVYVRYVGTPGDEVSA